MRAAALLGSLAFAGCSGPARIPEPSLYKSGLRHSLAETRRELTIVPIRKAVRGGLSLAPVQFALEHVGPPKLDQPLEAMAAWTQRYTLEGLAARGYTAAAQRKKRSPDQPPAVVTVVGRGTWSYKGGDEENGERLVQYDVKQRFEVRVCDGDLPSDCVVVRAPRADGADLKTTLALPVASAARLAGKQNAEVILAAFDAAAYKP